jgi:hypothetical protein
VSSANGLNVVLKNGILVGPPMQKKAKQIIMKHEQISLKHE